MRMNHVMTDIETMGKNPNAPIVAIGAVLFDPVAGELGNQLYVKVNLEDAVRTGGVMDASTVLWWLQQDDAARVELLRERGERMCIQGLSENFRKVFEMVGISRLVVPCREPLEF